MNKNKRIDEGILACELYQAGLISREIAENICYVLDVNFVERWC